MRVRMKDIAKLANVSEAAVSLVLNDAPSRISEEKKQEIKRIASELNYVPNIAAQSLAKNQSHIIGLVVPDIENPFFAKLGKEIETALRALGYLTIIVNSDDSFSNEQKLVQTLLNRGVDGLILGLSNEAFHVPKELQQFLSTVRVPFVLVDRPLTTLSINQVYFDSFKGGYDIAQRVIKAGHQKIALMVGDKKVPNAQSKIEGVQLAFETNSLEFKEEQVLEVGYHFEDGYSKSATVLQDPSITAIIATNDIVAFGVMKKARELKIKIPDDKSLIGYDQLLMTEMLDIPLASVEQNTHKLAEQSVQLLIKTLGKKDLVKEIILKPKFKNNKSLKKVKKVVDFD